MATGPTRETSAQCDCVNTHHSSAYSDTAYSEEPVRASTEGESLVWKDEHQSTTSCSGEPQRPALRPERFCSCFSRVRYYVLRAGERG